MQYDKCNDHAMLMQILFSNKRRREDYLDPLIENPSFIPECKAIIHSNKIWWQRQMTSAFFIRNNHAGSAS